MSVVAERYAEALFAVAGETQAVGAVRDGLELVQQLLSAVPQFRSFLANPEIMIDEKRALLASVFKQSLPTLGQQFMLMLVEKNRLNEWAEIHAAFELRWRRSQKLERAVVRSARPLDQDLLTQIDASLERWRGTQIDLVTELDPQLLGGIQVRIGSLLIDGSIRSQLNAIAYRLQTTPVN